jgi:hypothetical protein
MARSDTENGYFGFGGGGPIGIGREGKENSKYRMEERGRAEVFVRGSEETGMLSVTHRRAEAEALVIRCTWSVVALWFALWSLDEVRTYLGSRAPESLRIWNGMLNRLRRSEGGRRRRWGTSGAVFRGTGVSTERGETV